MSSNKNIKIMPFTEANFENAIIELFRDQLGYDYHYGPDVVRDYSQPLHLELVRASLQDINPWLPKTAIDETVNTSSRPSMSSRSQNTDRSISLSG